MLPKVDYNIYNITFMNFIIRFQCKQKIDAIIRRWKGQCKKKQCTV